ncbi:hypothetical protein RCZ04_09480 [Capnocytophaga sp. HP1101]
MNHKLLILLILYLLLLPYYGFAQVEQNKTLLSELTALIGKKEVYTQQKERKIKEAIDLLKVPNATAEQHYAINQRLFDEFKTYISDSAVYYVKENIRIAEELQKTDWQNDSRLELASLYIISGNYLDAADLLQSVPLSDLEGYDIIKYYNCYQNLYNNYAFNNPNAKEYINKSNRYRDLLLNLVDKNSTHYILLYAGVLTDAKRYDEAEKLLLDRFALMHTDEHEKAVLGYVLGTLYKKKKDIPNQIKYFTISASCDIKDAIKENASMLELASALFQLGEVENAYTCIKSAMEDATFCNAQLRSDEVMRIFPIIEKAYQERIHSQNTKLRNSLWLVGLFAVCLIIAVVLVTRQVKRIAKIRKELYHKNQDLEQLNEHLREVVSELNSTNQRLSEVNAELLESDEVKEAYIGQFFNLCSVYISKLEMYQKMLVKKAKERNWDELNKVLRSTEMIEHELKEFYKLFDDIFLHLFPNFIAEFNALLAEEERFSPRPHEMTPELRIFALIRLGITDSSKIATFLHYSTNTIYNYRTRVRNKAIVPRDSFEESVMKIGKSKING